MLSANCVLGFHRKQETDGQLSSFTHSMNRESHIRVFPGTYLYGYLVTDLWTLTVRFNSSDFPILPLDPSKNSDKVFAEGSLQAATKLVPQAAEWGQRRLERITAAEAKGQPRVAVLPEADFGRTAHFFKTQSSAPCFLWNSLAVEKFEVSDAVPVELFFLIGPVLFLFFSGCGALERGSLLVVQQVLGQV